MSNTNTIRDKQVSILKNMSYSNNLTLHRCPKRWEIDALGGLDSTEDDDEPHVTFAFGHAVGAGIQTLFIPGKSVADAKLAALMAWDIPLSEELPKKKKSFWYVLRSIDLAVFLVQEIKDEGWTIAEFNGQPAIEYSFVLHLPDGFRYNAHVDLILFHAETGRYKIVEVKTSGYSQIAESSYGNSSQALSYAVVLDYLVQHKSSYDVLYLVWSCPNMGWEQLPFTKSHLQKAEWIRDILYDVDMIKNLIKTWYFPKRGEACNDFFRTCSYYGACGYGDSYLGIEQPRVLDSQLDKVLSNKSIDKNNQRGYDVEIQFIDLLKDKLLQLEGK